MSEPGSPPPPRLRFADGEFLTRFPAGSPHALRLDCRHEKPGWQARIPGSQVEAQFAGTAVFFEGSYFEVVAAREVAGWVSYYLDPWDEAVVLRRIVELSPAATAQEAAARVQDARQRGTATALVVLAPLVGLLPAAYQERIERRYGLPASRATVWSAGPLHAVTTAAFVLWLGKSFAGAAGAGGSGARPWQGLASYFMAESLLRLGAALAAGEANGSLPVVLVVSVFDLLRGRVASRARPRLPPSSAVAGPLALADEVTRLAGEPARLEVVSRLPKPQWTRSTGIRFESRWYRLVDTQPAERDGTAVHRFVLAEDRAALSMRGACDYDPREVVTLEWEAQRARKATWVETFAPLWGLLDAASQERLAAAYDFDPGRSTRLSIVAAAVAGVLGASLAAVYLATGAGGAADGLILLAGGALVADGVRRAIALGRGRILPSWLAPLVRPFCAGALSASSPPAAR